MFRPICSRTQGNEIERTLSSTAAQTKGVEVGMALDRGIVNNGQRYQAFLSALNSLDSGADSLLKPTMGRGPSANYDHRGASANYDHRGAPANYDHLSFSSQCNPHANGHRSRMDVEIDFRRGNMISTRLINEDN